MNDSFTLKMVDLVIKPRRCYEYQDINVEGYRLIATKEEQTQAGLLNFEPHRQKRTRSFGHSPVRPYRDYYGQFTLRSTLIPDVLTVRFAIGYTILSKVVTVDDMSNFSWLRLSTGLTDQLYPNLSDQKQLLEYLLKHSPKSAFYVTRVYYYLQVDLYRDLVEHVMAQMKA